METVAIIIGLILVGIVCMAAFVYRLADRVPEETDDCDHLTDDGRYQWTEYDSLGDAYCGRCGRSRMD